MSPLTLPDDIKRELHTKLQTWFDRNKNNNLYGEGEQAQIQRLLDYIEVVNKGHVHTTNDKESLYHDFKSFFTQYDRRRGKDFCATFPRLADWYNGIELIKNYPKPEYIIKGKIQHFEEGVYQGEGNNSLFNM